MIDSGQGFSEDSVTRIGLLCVASFLLFQCSDLWHLLGQLSSPRALVLGVVWFHLLGAIILAGVATGSQNPTARQKVGLVAILISQWMSYSVHSVNSIASNTPSDNVVFSLQAAQLLSLGENPYGFDFLAGHSNLNASPLSTTPLLDGGAVTVLSYPALHVLVLLPIVGWGLNGVSFVFNFAYSLILILLYRKAAQPHRLLFLLPLLANSEYSRYPMYGGSDSVWVFLLALCIWYWKQPSFRGILFGLACAYKQTPWFLAPFLCLRVAKEGSWRELLRFSGLSFGTFAIVNLPFFWGNTQNWMKGIFDPALSALAPEGRGLSLLTQTEVLSFPRAYYSVLGMLALLSLLWFYYLNFSRTKGLVWLFPAVILFFSFRSLSHYFIYSLPLLMMDWESSFSAKGKMGKTLLWKAPAFAFLTAAVATSLLFWPQPSGVTARIINWHPDTSSVKTQAVIELENQSQKTIKPIFFGRTRWEPFNWYILEGPVLLKPGETASYRISALETFTAFYEQTGGRLLVTNAEEPNCYLASVDFPRPAEALSPRGVSKGLQRQWSRYGDVRQVDDDIIELRTNKNEYASVSRWVSAPERALEVQIQLPPDFSPESRLSLTLSGRNQDKISCYFDGSKKSGYFTPTHYFKGFPSSSEPIEIDIQALFLESGLKAPSFQYQMMNGVELIDRFLHLKWTLESSKPETARIKNFTVPALSPKEHLSNQLFAKANFRTIRGDQAVRERRYQTAMVHYQASQGFEQPRNIDPLGPFYVGTARMPLLLDLSESATVKLFLAKGSLLGFSGENEALKRVNLKIDSQIWQKNWQAPETRIYTLQFVAKIEKMLKIRILSPG